MGGNRQIYTVRTMIQQEHMGHLASLSEKNKGQVSISSAPPKKPRKKRVKVNEIET